MLEVAAGVLQEGTVNLAFTEVLLLQILEHTYVALKVTFVLGQEYVEAWLLWVGHVDLDAKLCI